MTTTTISDFRKKLFDYVSKTIQFNNPVQITTKEGSAILLSEADYNGLRATVEIMTHPGMTQKIMEAAQAPDEEYIEAEDLAWKTTSGKC